MTLSVAVRFFQRTQERASLNICYFQTAHYNIQRSQLHKEIGPESKLIA